MVANCFFVSIIGWQGKRVWVWVVALKSFGLEFRHRTRRGEPFDHDLPMIALLMLH